MTLKSRLVALASGAGLLVLLAAALVVWVRSHADLTGPDPNDATVVARGKVVYSQTCASCHGADLEGQPNWRHPLSNGRWPAPPHDASGHTWHHSDKVLFQVTKYGMGAMMPDRETDMPAFNGVLSDADIWAVLSFIESNWSPDIRARQQRMK